MKDCSHGKVDRIVTKSVSRLARNTEDLLSMLRMIKGFGVSVYRAPIDNDLYIKRIWKAFALDTEKLLVKKPKTVTDVFKTDGNRVVITSNYFVSTVKKKNVCKVTVTYEVYNDGAVKVSAECTKSKNLIFAPRFGLTLEMPKVYSNVEYYGMGDSVNAPDFCEHAMLGIYKTKVADMHEEYIKPQESSMRSGVRWAKLTDDDGNGLMFLSLNGRMTFSADHYTSQQCAKAQHIEELQECNTTFLHFDSYHLGVGSNACGPIPTKDYKKSKLTGEKITLLVTPQ